MTSLALGIHANTTSFRINPSFSVWVFFFFFTLQTSESKVEDNIPQTLLIQPKLCLPSHVKWKCTAACKPIFHSFSSWLVARSSPPTKPDSHHQFGKLSLTEEGQNENRWSTTTLFSNTAIWNSAWHSGDFDSFFIFIILAYLYRELCDYVALLHS